MISFTPSAEQQLIIETVRRFAAERMRPAAHDADEARAVPPEVIAKGWDLGLLPSSIPEAYGGFGERHSATTGVLAVQELAAGDTAATLHLLTPNLFALPILHCGTEAQKARWLPQTTEGGFAPYTAAFCEPHWDFNAAAMQTAATRDGDSYVISGHKAYVPLAESARALLVYASDAGQTQAFIVDGAAAGLSVLPRESNMGARALATYELKFDEVRVPAEDRLGGEQGADIEMLLSHSRVTLAAIAAGMSRAAYEYARQYALGREAFGKPIAQNQAVAFMLAEMAIEVDAIATMALEAAWKLDAASPDAHRSAALAKMYADEAALFVTDRAVQVLGGHGYIREHPVERWLRDARGLPVFLGVAMA